MTLVGWLEFVVSRLALVSLGVSALAVMLGWHRRERARACLASSPPASEVPRFELGRTPFAGGTLDVAAEIRTVLTRLAPVATREFVQLELAVQPDLMVRADARALQQALGDLVSIAIRHAPCGRVLVGAMRHGGQVQIWVTDDGTGPPEATQEAALRDAERLIALQGGTIEVETHGRDVGSTLLLRLPEQSSAHGAAGPDPPAMQPAVEADVAATVWIR